MSKLSDICAINMGQSPDSSTYNDSGNGLPFFQGNADFGKVHPSVRVWCSDPKKTAQPNDILISVRAPIGALNIADVQCCIGRGLASLTVDHTKGDSNYVWYALESKVNYLVSMGTGSTFKAIGKNVLFDLDIPLPSLSTQKQIAANLDKATQTIDLCNAILEKLDLLVKARFVEMFGSCNESKRLEEYTELITKGASPKWQGIDYSDEGTLFVTSENVREGYLDFTKKKYLPNDINKILPRSVLKRNDILINIVNASIGRVAIYDSDELANINQAVALVRLKQNSLNLLYLLTYLNSDDAIRAYDFMKVGGDKANLSLKNIADLKIPVAPLELQNQFADFVKQIDKSKFAVQQVLAKAETLKKALMQEYFG